MEDEKLRAYVHILRDMSRGLNQLAELILGELEEEPRAHIEHTTRKVQASGGWVTSDGEVFSPPSKGALEGTDGDDGDVEIVYGDELPADEEPAE